MVIKTFVKRFDQRNTSFLINGRRKRYGEWMGILSNWQAN